MGWVLFLGGAGAIALGALMIFAGGMSDAPAEGDAVSSRGCVIAVGGIIALIVGAVLLFKHVVG